MLQFHVAYKDRDGDEVSRCGKSIFFTDGGESCPAFDCTAKIVRLDDTLENVSGRAYFIARGLLDKWAHGGGVYDPTPPLTHEDVQRDIEEIVVQLRQWASVLYRALEDNG